MRSRRSGPPRARRAARGSGLPCRRPRSGHGPRPSSGACRPPRMRLPSPCALAARCRCSRRTRGARRRPPRSSPRSRNAKWSAEAAGACGIGTVSVMPNNSHCRIDSHPSRGSSPEVRDDFVTLFRVSQGRFRIGPSTVLRASAEGPRCGHRPLLTCRSRYRWRCLSALSRTISRTQWWPGRPVTPPPAWVALEAWYSPGSACGSRRSPRPGACGRADRP